MGKVWGLPSASLYWITKESKVPAGTVQERRAELLVTSEMERSPKLGWGGAVVGNRAEKSEKRQLVDTNIIGWIKHREREGEREGEESVSSLK